MDSRYFTVSSGGVDENDEAQLCYALVHFARQRQWQWVIINATLNGSVYCDASADGCPGSPISRTWRQGAEGPEADFKCCEAEVQDEAIRGVKIKHPNGPWLILWNCAAAGAFVGYRAFELAKAEYYFRGKRELRPMPLKISPVFIRQELQRPGIMVSGWLEHKLRIGVGSTDSDANDARRCLELLAQHGRGVIVDEQ